MGDLSVQFEGTTYNLPDDASNDEISEFISNHQQAMHPPSLKRPQVEGLDYGSMGTGTFQQRMATSPRGDVAGQTEPSLAERALDTGIEGVKSLATSVARGSAPNVAYGLLRKARPSLPEGIGQFSPSDAINIGLTAMPEAEAGPAALDESAIGRRSAQTPGSASSAAGPFSSTRPEGVPNQPVTSPSAASKLVEKVPGKRTITQDVKDLASTRLRKPWTWGKGVDAVKSILQKVTGQAETEPAAESAPVREAPAREFSFSAKPQSPGGPTLDHPISGRGENVPWTSTVPQREMPVKPRSEPLWKQQASTDVQPEVPETNPPINPRNQMSRRMKRIDTQQDRNIQDSMQIPIGSASKLKKIPANSIMDDLEPEGPKEVGMGPGAQFDPSRRSFLKKAGQTVAGAAASKVLPTEGVLGKGANMLMKATENPVAAALGHLSKALDLQTGSHEWAQDWGDESFDKWAKSKVKEGVPLSHEDTTELHEFFSATTEDRGFEWAPGAYKHLAEFVKGTNADIGLRHWFLPPPEEHAGMGALINDNGTLEDAVHSLTKHLPEETRGKAIEAAEGVLSKIDTGELLDPAEIASKLHTSLAPFGVDVAGILSELEKEYASYNTPAVSSALKKAEPEGAAPTGASKLQKDTELPTLQKQPGSLRVTDQSAMGTINRDMERRGLGTPGRNLGRRTGDTSFAGIPDPDFELEPASSSKDVEHAQARRDYAGSPLLKTRGEIDPSELRSTQGHGGADPELALEYARAMQQGDKFPPALVLRTRSGERIIDDGHHRATASGMLRRDQPAIMQMADLPSRAKDNLDDQGVKQEMETKLRRKHMKPWGSIYDVIDPPLFDEDGEYQGNPNSISAELMQRHSDEVTRKLLKKRPN